METTCESRQGKLNVHFLDFRFQVTLGNILISKLSLSAKLGTNKTLKVAQDIF